ncbi:MAG: oligopeptide/dipeptide ABC transporter ATP-binding protein, partial [Actinomycetota bacterium]
NPKHPYTGALLSAVPLPDPRLAEQKKRIILEGDVPSPINPPSGCRFHPRCPNAQLPPCDTEEPMLLSHHTGQVAACHFPLADRSVTPEAKPGRTRTATRGAKPAATTRRTASKSGAARPPRKRKA